MARTLLINGNNGTALHSQNSTQYIACATCGTSIETLQARAKITWRAAGTMAKLGINVVDNTNDEASATLRLRKDGNYGNAIVTIPAYSTGWLSDSTGTDAISVGSVLDYQFVTPSDLVWGGIYFSAVVMTFAATTDTVIRYAGTGFGDMSDGEINYFGLSHMADPAGAHTNESWHRFDTNAAAVYKNLYVYVSQNLSTPTGQTITLRQNGAITSLSVGIAPLQSGIIENVYDITGHSAVTVPNDDVCMEIQTSDLGAFVMEIVSVEATSSNKTFHAINDKAPSLALMGAALTAYLIAGGGGSTVATESKVKVKASIKATTSNLTLYVSSNTILA